MRRKKIFNIIFLVVVSSVFVLTGAFSWFLSKEKENKQQIVLGFCPTMEVYANEILKNNPNIDIRMFANSSIVLDHLKQGKIDAGLIGRKARKNEISLSVQEKRIKQGWTLLSSYGRLIQNEELLNEIIYTYLHKEIVDVLLPGHKKIVFCSTKEEAFRLGSKGVVLVDWQDVPDDYQMLIPIEKGKKVSRFRSPVIYAKHEVLNRI